MYRPAHVYLVISAIQLVDVDMNVKATENVDPKNFVKTSDANRLVHSVEPALHVLVLRIIVLYANVQKDTLAAHTQSVDRNVTEMLIVPRVDRLVSTESVKILAMVHVVLMLIVIYVA